MDERFWIHLLPWRQKNKTESKSAQIKLAPKLTINREEGWANLELLLANHSRWPIWVREVAIALMDLDTKLQTAISTGKAKHEILQNVGPNEALRVSIGKNRLWRCWQATGTVLLPCPDECPLLRLE